MPRPFYVPDAPDIDQIASRSLSANPLSYTEIYLGNGELQQVVTSSGVVNNFVENENNDVVDSGKLFTSGRSYPAFKNNLITRRMSL